VTGAAAVAAIALVVAACSGGAQLLGPVGSDIDGAGGAPVAPGPAEVPEGEADGAHLGAYDAVTTVARDDTRVVRTGWLTLRVDAIDAAVRSAEARLAAMGGYVSASNQVNDEAMASATVAYRVPVERWEDALAALRNVATEVVDERTESVEVTAQIVDLAARIRNLRASETALVGILEKATKISDVLEVQRELTATREQIEQLEAQKALVEDQADMATVTATYVVEVVAVAQTAKGWDPATIIDEAAASLVGALQGVATAAIWFAIVWLPFLLVGGILVLVVALLLRRSGLLRRPSRPSTPPATPLPASPAD
jgi:uncharacterized protein YhaN